jgi:hypothetical protein
VDGDRFTHNPEVAGSNPAPATRSEALSDLGKGLSHVVCARICARPSVLMPPRRCRPGCRPRLPVPRPMISSASVFATCRSASRSVCTYCFMVNATSAWPMRLLSAFQSIFASRLHGQRGRRAGRSLPGHYGDVLVPASQRPARRGAGAMAAGRATVHHLERRVVKVTDLTWRHRRSAASGAALQPSQAIGYAKAADLATAPRRAQLSETKTQLWYGITRPELPLPGLILMWWLHQARGTPRLLSGPLSVRSLPSACSSLPLGQHGVATSRAVGKCSATRPTCNHSCHLRLKAT